MDIEEGININNKLEDIYDNESDSFTPDDINDELENNNIIIESEICSKSIPNKIMLSDIDFNKKVKTKNNSNIHKNYYYLYNKHLSDEDIIEEKIDEYYSFKESPIFDFENYLSNEVENIYLKMSPLELFMLMFDEYITKIVEYTKSFAYNRYNSNSVNINKEEIYIYIYIFFFFISI